MNAWCCQRTVSAIWRGYLAVIALCGAPPTFAQTQHESQHGAHEIFVSPDASIVWAVLKAPTGDKAAVWLRIVNKAKKFSHFSIDGVDPFSKKRERVQQAMPLGAEARVQSDRDTFSDLPSREIHFYRSEADLRSEKPALTVYYFGVPDQSPEFTARAALDNYLSTAKRSAPAELVPKAP